METLIHIMHLEDDPADSELVQARLAEADLNCRIIRAGTRDELENTLRDGETDIILADYRLPMYDGMSALRLAKEICPDVPFIFVSSAMGEEAAVEALTQGATDYVLKKDLSRLAPAIKRALQKAKDLKEHNLMVKTLTDSVTEMHSILDNIGIGVALISPKMEILELNKRMRQWFPNIDPSQHPICYKSFNTPSRHEVCAYCPTCKTLKDGRIYEATTETPQDGIIRNYRIVSTPLFDSAGKVVAAIEMVEDITERMHAEKALQESYEIINKSPAVVFLWKNTESRPVEYVSENVKKIFGYTAEELMSGKVSFATIVHPGDLERVSKEVSTYSQEKDRRKFTQEYRIVTKDGKIRQVDDRIWIRRGKNDDITHYQGIILDITERKQAEEALREKQNELLEAQQIAHIGNWWHDLVTGEIYWSDECFKFLGREPQKPTPELTVDVIHPADWHILQQAMDEAAAGKKEHDHEFRIVRPDGDIRWIHNRWLGIYDETGKEIKRVGTHQDITERKRVEEALKASEARYIDLYENAPDMYASVNARTALIEECNQKLADMLGLPKEEIIGRPVFEIYHPNCRNKVKEVFKEFQERGEIRDKELQLLRKDGSKLDVSLNVSAVRAEDGTILFSRSTLRDITERKRNDSINSTRLHLIQFAVTHSMDELLEETLNEAEKLTDSLIGFYHFVESNQKTLALQNWSTRTKAEFCKAEGKGMHYPIAEAGVWVDCVYQEKPVIHNDYASLPHRKGMSEGHAEVVRELVVPVFRDKIIKAILGVGNKPTDYVEKDVEAISLLADLAWEIAERKQAEEALKESEERFRTIVNNSTPIVFLTDQEGKVLLTEGKMLAGMGLQPGDLVGKSVFDVWQDYPAIINAFEMALGGELFEGIVELDELIFEVFYSPHKDLEGNIIGVIGMGLDITEQKRMEQELIFQEQKYRTLIESVPDFIVRYDRDLRRTYVNPAWEKASGLSAAEVIGVAHSEIPRVPIPSVDEYVRKLRQAMETGITQAAEFTWINANDVKLFLEYVIVPEYDHHGKIQGVLAVGRNITERKQAEESIRKLSQAVEQSPVSIIITDLGGTIEFVNTKFTQITGYTYEEAVGQNPRILKTGETSDEEYHRLWKIISSGGVWEGEFHNRKKNGELFWEHATISPVRNEDGVITHYVAVKEDITERKKLEEQLRQTQKMDAVGQLAGGVAHDFNNMLGVIIGHAEMALGKATSNNSLREDIEEILVAGRRSTEIIRKLLAFARKQTIMPKILYLNETVEEMLKLLRRLIVEDINLAWLPGTDVWPVKMDPSQIDQILANLCVNARDAINGVGKITIETQNIDIDEAYCAKHKGFSPGQYVMLIVSDNGSGMDKKTLDKIFEPFFTTKEMGKGTGLGMSIVYGIVKQNNGFINVYSEPGHGSTIKIYLPRHTVEKERIQEESPVVPTAHGFETILLVEDDSLVRIMAKRMLEKLGYTVLTSSTPGEAKNVVSENSDKINLLITDVVMPEMTGRDLEKKLHSICPKLKCLFMSGYTGNVIAEHGILDKDVNFIQKPFSYQDLAAKVREMLDGE